MNIEQSVAGTKADELIATEVAIQDRMWGDANERADATNNQMVAAGLAQVMLVYQQGLGHPPEDALDIATQFYPETWNGFRTYGSTVANLVVASAFLRSEIKRRLLLGEDTTRTKRGEAYKGPDFPYISSEDAAKALS